MLYTILTVVHLVLFIIALIDIIQRSMAIEKKILWIVLIFLLPLVGLILYYLVGRK